MPSLSSKPQADNRHFLRTGAESESPADPEGALPYSIDATPSPTIQWWPQPPSVQLLMKAMAQWERFAVLAVDIDAESESKISPSFSKDLKQALTQITETHGGLWFPWQKHRLGAIIPDIAATEADAMARSLQHDLAHRHIETISIGISEFPLQDFDPAQSLINAAKALDHGAFFGADSRVLFDSISLNISADRFYQTGELNGAIAEYRKALELDPANINARNSLGVCLAEIGDPEAARTEFERVCQRHPADAMALFNLGLIDLNQGDGAAALRRFESAYAADASIFEITYQLGKLLYEQHNPDRALSFLEAGDKIRGNYAPLLTLMGRCLSDLGQTDAAIDALKKAIKLNPNNATALSDLGALYAEKGENIDICLTFCRQSVAIEPTNALFHCRLAHLYHVQGQWDQALSQYEKAAELGHDVIEQLKELHSRASAMGKDAMRCA